MVDPGGSGSSGHRLPAFDRGTEWLRGEGEASDVVLSSRVRYARNLEGLPFQATATIEDQQRVLDLCRAQVMSARLGHQMMWVDLGEISEAERELLVERHLISRQHARGKIAAHKPDATRPRGVAIGLPDERLSIMVNEEDHLRVQVIRTGLDLDAAQNEIDRVDDALESGLDYAFGPRFGYLTCCPTNVGTGARYSVMLHLPALKLAGEIEKVKRAAGDMALAVRGFYGEGSEAAGDLYQLSNQTTLGKSEKILLAEMQQQIVPRVIDYERHARESLMKTRKIWLEDRVHRAIGTLRSARLLRAGEAMQLLGTVRLGVLLGLADGFNQAMTNGLMLSIQKAHMQLMLGRELDPQQLRIERATFVRTKLGV